MHDLKKITFKVEEVIRETGAYILKESESFNKNSAENKGFNDFVSYVDRMSEKILVDRLGKIMPDAGFIAEEGTSSKKGGRFRWVIDPLDGTTNFIHGLHPFAISVALVENIDILAGIVHEVNGNETFTAWKGGGSWLNGNQIYTSKATSLRDSLIATGFPYSDFSQLDPYMNCLAHLCKHSHGVRRFGSASIDLSYVACGRFDCFYEYGLPWDVAAGIILIREAGGRAGDFSGNENNFAGDEIIAANSFIYNQFLEIVSNFMH